MTVYTDDSIVLTGCGWVTAFAAGSIADVLTGAPAARFAPSPEAPYWAVPDERLDDYPDLARELKRDKGAWLTAAALEHARRQASLEPGSLEPERVGMVLGCALAGQLGMIEFANEVRQQSPRFVSPIHFPQTVGNYIAGALARAYLIRGPNATLSCGSASGLDAIVEGASLLAGGAADVVFAGGTETLSKELTLGFAEPDATFSEGACFFVMEKYDRAAARGVTPLAVVTRPQQGQAAGGAPPNPAGAVVSVAGLRLGGAILIEHWTGRCFAAAGAAAVAAAIGAAAGRELPLVDPSDSTAVAVGALPVDALPVTDGALRAVVVADADHRCLLELALPRVS